MNRKEAMRQTHQIDTLTGLGFSTEEADKTIPMDGKPEILNPTAGRK